MNEFDRAELVDDPGPSSDAMKRREGCLTSGDLAQLSQRLAVLAGYFENGSECRRMVEDCREVAEGLRAQWIRAR